MDALQRMACVVPASFSNDQLAPSRPSVAITFDDAFVSVIDNGLPELAAKGFHCTLFVPVGVLGNSPTWAMEELDDAAELVASAEQLRNACSGLVTLGSHTLTHPHLSRISLERAEFEVHDFRRQLRSLIGEEVELFAFPYGDQNPSVLIELCRQAGYRYVFTAVPGNVILGLPISFGGGCGWTWTIDQLSSS